jgi:hypothetical protein
MMRFLKRGGLALAAFLLVGTQTTGPVAADGELTELQIELVGLPLSASQRDVQVRVTNISKWWAQPTTARMETLKPSAGNVVDDIAIPNLDPGQSYDFNYKLDAACNGHEVKAAVSPAQNYAGVPGLGHTTQRAVCPTSGIDRNSALTNPAPDLAPPIDRNSALTEPAPDLAPYALPEHLRPGTHATNGRYPPLIFTPAAVNSLTRDHRGGCPWVFQLDTAGLVVVGWMQRSGTCPTYRVAQTAVSFDLSRLFEADRPFITKALLTFDETPTVWKHGDGAAWPVGTDGRNGCVSVVGTATVDWTSPSFQPGESLFPNQFAWNDAAGSREWDVASHVRSQLAYRNDPELGNGYVLQGGLSDVQGHDDDSCLSEISNLQLTISYVVPD